VDVDADVEVEVEVVVVVIVDADVLVGLVVSVGLDYLFHLMSPNTLARLFVTNLVRAIPPLPLTLGQGLVVVRSLMADFYAEATLLAGACVSATHFRSRIFPLAFR
jgi:hypothetical protein